MRVLVVGSGGREHALAWRLSSSPTFTELHAAPGNPGIARLATCHPVAAEDGDGLRELARSLGVLEPSSRLDVIVTDQTVSLTEVMGAVERTGIRICSVVTLEVSGQRELVLRVATLDPAPAVEALRAAGYTLRDPRLGHAEATADRRPPAAEPEAR